MIIKTERIDGKLKILKEKIISNKSDVSSNMIEFYGSKPKFIIFLSVSDGDSRARVVHSSANTLESTWRNAVNLLKKTIAVQEIEPCWIKADIVREIDERNYSSFSKKMISVNEANIKEGISLDPLFNLALLGEEVKANLFFSGMKFEFENINSYLKVYQNLEYPVKEKNIENIYVFKTFSFIEEDCLELGRNQKKERANPYFMLNKHSITDVKYLKEIANRNMLIKAWSEALKKWKEILDVQKENPDPVAFSKIGYIYRIKKQYNQASKILNDGYKLFPQDIDINLQLGELAFVKKDYTSAVQYLKLVIKRKRSGLIYMKLARSLRRLGRLDEAAKIIQTGMKRFSGSIQLFIEYAINERERENLNKAVEILEEIINKFKAKTPFSVFRDCSTLFLITGQPKKSCEVLNSAKAYYPDELEIDKLLKKSRSILNVDFNVLAEKKNKFRILHYKQRKESNVLFVTFGIATSTFSSEPFGLPFLLEQGFDHIHVAQSKRTQYQNLSIKELKDIVLPYCQNKKVFTYGASLGGYAAIYFAGILNAQAIVSAPRYSASKYIKGKLNRKIPVKHLEILEVPLSEYQPILFYDTNYSNDVNFIEKAIIPAYPKTKLYPLKYAGHSSLVLLQQSGILKETILNIVNNVELDFSEAQSKFKETVRYLEEKSKHEFRKGLYEKSIQSAKKCLLKSDSLHAYNILIQSFSELGKKEKANSIRKKALKIYPENRLSKIKIE